MENYSYNSSYPGSGGSSPLSREIEFENPPPWEDSQQSNLSLNPAVYKVKFMCSYGGKIQPRPHDTQLSYIGGETKILAVDRNIRYNSLLSKLIALSGADNISFKYQLPGEDLDALISVTNDEDIEHMMHEYDRLCKVSPKPARLRIFIFPNPNNPSLNSSARSYESDDVKLEKERFVEALNSASVITAPAADPEVSPDSNVDFLFGLEKENRMAETSPAQQNPAVPFLDERLIEADAIQKHIQDLQRIRIEEQQGNYRRKSDENIVGGYTGGEYYKVTEQISPPAAVTGGVSYWPENQVPGGVYASNPVNAEQPVYMIPAPASAYHSPMVRQMPVGQTQGYYTVQMMQPDVYRDQQMYGVVQQTTAPQTMPMQRATGYPEGYGMVRPTITAGGMAPDAGYAQLAYDGGMGRQVYYTAQGGGVMSAPPQGQLGQYPVTGGALNLDGGGTVVARTTQGSL